MPVLNEAELPVKYFKSNQDRSEVLPPLIFKDQVPNSQNDHNNP